MSNTPMKLLLFPWLAYGHLKPFFALAKKLAERGFSIHFCSTPINLDSIRDKINPQISSSIHLVKLHLPESPELPPHYHTTNGLPHHLLPTLKKAVHMSKPQLSIILEAIQPHVVIYDMNVSWFAALTSRHQIPAVRFMISTATLLAYFCHMTVRPGVPFPLPGIYLTDFQQAQAQATLEVENKDTAGDDPEDELPNRFCEKITLVKTCKEFEGESLDYLSNLMDWKTFPVCAFLHEHVDQETKLDDRELIQWLDKKSKQSTVFISSGSEYFFKEEEIREIASGLELCDVNFIWALRFPTGESEKTNVEGMLPDGFMEKIGDKGKIVEGWAPQAQILVHSSIGGFLSHCGLNLVMECIERCVPIIALPMHLDQPLNARLVVKTGVAVEVMRDENGAIKKENIANAIKNVILGETGEKLRTKMRDLVEKINATEEEELDGITATLTQLGSTVGEGELRD